MVFVKDDKTKVVGREGAALLSQLNQLQKQLRLLSELDRLQGEIEKIVTRYNDEHDERGRFATKGGGGGGGSSEEDSGDSGGGSDSGGDSGGGSSTSDDIPVYGAGNKTPLGDNPLGTVVNGKNGLSIKPANAKAAAALERLEKEGASFGEVEKRYETLFDESDEKDGKWYHEREKEMGAYAREHGFSQEQVTAVTAAMSARMAWDHDIIDPKTGKVLMRTKPNWEAATSIMQTIKDDKPFLMNGKLVKPSSIKDARALALAHPDLKVGLTDNVTKSIEIMRGGDPTEVLGGNKVRSFYNDMLHPGTSKSTTIDTLMVHAAMGTSSISPAKLGRLLGSSPYNYDLYAKAVKYIASKHKLPPHEVQARIWYAWRNKSGIQARQATARMLKAKAKAKKSKAKVK